MGSRIETPGAERWAPALGGAALVVGAGLVWQATRGRPRGRAVGPQSTVVEEAVAINRPASELYRFWRDFQRLPTVIPQLRSVEVLDHRRSRWIAEGPRKHRAVWIAEIVNDIPNELIAWRTIENPDVASAGYVHFKPATGGRGTHVRASFRCEMPGGALGSAVAWAFGDQPKQVIREGLRRFKQLMETGEIATTNGQPRGAR